VEHIFVSPNSSCAAALTDLGEVFTWGTATAPLGREVTKVSEDPMEVETLRNKRVVSLSLSMFHAVCVTAKGEVYTWGANTFHQLGHGPSSVTAKIPKKNFCSGGKNSSILCCWLQSHSSGHTIWVSAHFWSWNEWMLGAW